MKLKKKSLKKLSQVQELGNAATQHIAGGTGGHTVTQNEPVHWSARCSPELAHYSSRCTPE